VGKAEQMGRLTYLEVGFLEWNNGRYLKMLLSARHEATLPHSQLIKKVDSRFCAINISSQPGGVIVIFWYRGQTFNQTLSA
jgi:hypothetical protein